MHATLRAPQYFPTVVCGRIDHVFENDSANPLQLVGTRKRRSCRLRFLRWPWLSLLQIATSPLAFRVPADHEVGEGA
eukprot:2878341-Amphidinium_carterae.1